MLSIGPAPQTGGDAAVERICRLGLDTGLFELRYQGSPRQVEPQVFNLIELLVRNHHRVVGGTRSSRRTVEGRVVTDATRCRPASKSARQARRHWRAQALDSYRIRAGFPLRWRVVVVEATLRPRSRQITGRRDPPPAETCEDALVTRPSIAVLPFETVGIGETPSTIADALPP